MPKEAIEEIRIKNSTICSLKQESTTALSSLASLVSSLDLLHLKTVSDSVNSNHFKRHSAVQEKRLFQLTQDSPKTLNIKPDEVIFNYSNKALSNKEKSVLVKGLTFSILLKKLNTCDFHIPFKLLYWKIQHEPVSSVCCLDQDFIRTKMKNIALLGFRSHSRPSYIFTHDEREILTLRRDQSIIIVKPDKGNGLVIPQQIGLPQKDE